MGLETFAWLVLLFPLAGMLLIALTSQMLPRRVHGVIGTAAIGLSFLAAIGVFAKLQALAPDQRQVVAVAWDYARAAGIDAQLSLLIDPLSCLMILVVSGVSTLIHLYSVAYMRGDRGYSRFFAYLNYFVFSMLLLVLAGNFLVLIVGWAFVGAASYMLISFWYRRTTATSAGIKAFVINVVGDVGLVLGTFFVFRGTGSLDFLKTFDAVGQAFGHNDASLVAGCILLLVGAFAKSAQVPLHTWLPDAMEGPTPVSALIHAATMVTAGVYLIARMHPLFEQAPAAADVGAIVGCLTLLIAATIGLVVTDLKRVIAYSTMSQIGYMILGVSVAAYGAGLFHLMTHAFFKALLFMGAGSVIGAMGGVQSLDRMGGFRKAMPFTFVTFTVGAFALAGFPLLSGFFSKDEILAYTFERGGWYAVLGTIGYVAALLTAFYAGRMVFRVFFGAAVPEARELEEGHLAHGSHANPATGEDEDTDVGFPGAEHHTAEHEWPMKVAMAPLALLAVVAGVLGIPGVTDTLEHFLEPTFADSRFAEAQPSAGAEWVGLAVGGLFAIIGLVAAFRYFLGDQRLRVATRERLGGLHQVLINKWYFDEIFDRAIVRPVAAFGRFGRNVVESTFVQGVLVGGTVGIVRAGTSFARSIQTGELRSYAALLLMGVSGLVLYFLIVSS